MWENFRLEAGEKLLTGEMDNNFRWGAWCSGLTCGPVKAEIAGSNPVVPASVQEPLEKSGSFVLRMGERVRFPVHGICYTVE